jgi:cation diffusion facilitator CzcD-associated flavoprotein CzcO
MGDGKGGPSVAIIGAGLGGVGLAVHLKRAGLTNFEVFDGAEGPGGTWWHNRYPGVAVDVPSCLYSYSFKKDGPWKRRYATGEELCVYIEEVLDENDLRAHFHFQTTVEALHWNEDEELWDVVFAGGETRRFQVVVPALGALDVPNYPTLPGMDDFKGPMFHTARWEGHDLRGKRVAFLGGGSTAAQVVPRLAAEVGQLDVYQRSPHWVLPKEDGKIDRAQRRRRPWLLWRERWSTFKEWEGFSASFDDESPGAAFVEGLARGLLEVVEDPEVRAALTPDFPVFCKRPVQAGPEYYESFNRAGVELVPKAVSGFTAGGVIDADGVEREADAVVLSTGYRVGDYLGTIEVTGIAGERIKDTWEEARGPYAFLGMMFPRFPNLFMIYGPNSQVVQSTIFVMECQARFITRVVKRMRRRGWRTARVRPWATGALQSWLEERLEDNPARGNCNNYYINEHGKLTTLFPGDGRLWWFLNRFGDLPAVDGRRRRTDADVKTVPMDGTTGTAAAASAVKVAE